MNTPTRFRYQESLRAKRWFLIGLSGAILISWPALTGRSWLIPPIALVVGVLYFYSRPFPLIRRRLKDIPVLKTFIAPLFIASVLVFWPVLETRRSLGSREVLIFFWCFLVLCVNSVSFDLRDIRGDTKAGTRTLPVVLGANWTAVFLGILCFVVTVMSPMLGLHRVSALLLSVSLALGTGLLFGVLRASARPMVFSFAADVFLCLPALALILAK